MSPISALPPWFSSTAGPFKLLRSRSPLFFCCVLFLSFLYPAFPTSAASWQGDFNIRVFSPRTETILFSGKIFQKELKVRIEPSGAKEIALYDFERSEKMRIFPDDQIYFRTTLSLAEQIKAVKEAWVAPPAPYTISRILLWSGRLEAKAARLYLVTLEREGSQAYSLRWVSQEHPERVLRIVYPGPANETVIVDYKPVTGEPPPPDFFIPPPEYLSLNPF